MAKRMLIDATHPEETRVVVLNGNRLEEFDFELSMKRQVKGNIYLAKVTRVEPSLQAAFVEYGNHRHGFLAFSEIHPDYYKIPLGDRTQFDRVAGHEEAEGQQALAGPPKKRDVSWRRRCRSRFRSQRFPKQAKTKRRRGRSEFQNRLICQSTTEPSLTAEIRPKTSRNERCLADARH